jgi:hypothetical protein
MAVVGSVALLGTKPRLPITRISHGGGAQVAPIDFTFMKKPLFAAVVRFFITTRLRSIT